MSLSSDEAEHAAAERAARLAPTASRSGRLRRERNTERIFHGLTLGAACLVLLLLGGVVISLVVGAWPALRSFGFGFFTREVWNPVTEQFGALAPIFGTLVTALIAMLLAIPAGFGVAVFLTELSPPVLRRPIELRSSCSPRSPVSFTGFGVCSFWHRSCSVRFSRG